MSPRGASWCESYLGKWPRIANEINWASWCESMWGEMAQVSVSRVLLESEWGKYVLNCAISPH